MRTRTNRQHRHKAHLPKGSSQLAARMWAALMLAAASAAAAAVVAVVVTHVSAPLPTPPAA